MDPVQMSTTISQTIEEAGLRKAVVTLPPEVTGNAEALLVRCSVADFDASTCPDNTIVGEAVAASPLQSQALSGSVYLVDGAGGSPFPDLGVDLRGALALKVKGSISLQPVPGSSSLQIVVTFDGLPDIPLSEFTLTFFDGENGLNFVSRSPCKPPPFVIGADFTGQAGQALTKKVNPTTKCAGGGGGGGKPKARASIGTLRSGKPTLRISMHAGDAAIRNARVKLPKGLKAAGKRRFERGTTIAGGSIKGKGRTLRLKAKGGGVERIRTKLAKGAIRAGHGLRQKRLKPLKLTIRDADGGRTKLSVKAR
jgi:hypothetical protein